MPFAGWAGLWRSLGGLRALVNPSRIRDSVMKIEGAGQESVDEVLTLTPSFAKGS
jgi:hypothetical protein